MKINLKFFNDPVPGNEETTPPDTADTGNPNEPVTEKEGEEEKTYSQAEVEKIVKSRLARAKNDINPDELQAFKAWQENQKTEAEKAADTLRELETSKSKLLEIEQENIALKKGVDPKYMDFILFTARKAVSEGADFEDALTSAISENEAILKASTPPPRDTGAHQSRTAPGKFDYRIEHKKAIESGNLVDAIAIKQRAAAEGIYF